MHVFACSVGRSQRAVSQVCRGARCAGGAVQSCFTVGEVPGLWLGLLCSS